MGRGEDKPDEGRQPGDKTPSPRDRGQAAGGGQSSDLDELWRDINRKLSGLFGGGSGGGAPKGGQPDMRNAGVGIALIGGLLWRCGWPRAFYRQRRSAGRHHPVWKVQINCRGWFQLAIALSNRAPRVGVRDPNSLCGCW